MKKFSWKHLNSKIKLISATVIILMLVQMLILIIVSSNRRVELFNSHASEAFSNSLVSMDETLDYLKETTISFSQNYSVYPLFFDDAVSQQELQTFKRAKELIPTKISSLIKNAYVYNAQTSTIYADNMSRTHIDSVPDSLTKEIITSGRTSGGRLRLFVAEEIFLIDADVAGTEQMFRICYFPSKQTESCILLDVALYDLVDMFKTYRKDFSAEVFIASGTALPYGTGTPAMRAELEQSLELISRQNYSNPVFHRCGSTEYLVLKKTSEKAPFNVYSLIPSGAIPTDFAETKMLFSINMCLLILICLAAVLFLLFRNFNQAFSENANLKLLRSEEQMNKQFAQKKECLIHCLINPNERDFLAAAEYIQALLQKSDSKTVPDAESLAVSLLRIEIDNYKSFSEAHTTQDARLYKYGILNICDEILNTHTRAILIYEKNEEAVFLIIDNDNPSENCRKAIEECRNAVKDYIDTDFFAFLSRCDKLTSLPQLNKQTIAMSEYIFMLDEPCFLTSDDIKAETEVSSREATDLLEAIFNAPDEDTRDREFSTFFEALNGMLPDEAKNILWIFMFRLYNIGKRNLEEIDSIETLVGRFNEIRKLSEMYEFFSDFCDSVFLSDDTGDTGSTSVQDRMVLTVQAIIERSFREPDFCCDHIADEMNSSKVYLSRKYKNLTGISISEEILSRRMTAFAHELITTDKSIKIIISDIGGANYNYYMALFKKRFSMTPTEYRKNYKSNPGNADSV